jgi:predicted Zn-dependent peptidase
VVRAALLGLSLVALGCAEEPDAPPALRFDSRKPACTDVTGVCLNAEARTFEVAGLRVIHKYIAGDPIVTATVLFDRAPDFADPETAHAQFLLMQLISWWGSEQYLGRWDDELGRLGATHWSACGLDYAQTGVVAPTTTFAGALHMLASAVLAPPIESLSSDDFTQIKTAYRQQFETADDDADGAASAAGWALISDGHPYQVRARHLDAIGRLQVSSLQSAWAQLLHRSRRTIVVAGDIERDVVSRLINDEFGGFGEQGTFMARVPTPSLLASPTRTKILQVDGAPSWQIYGYFRAPAARKEAEFAALKLGAAVLSRRLFDRVRDELGLVYDIGLDIRNYRAAFGTLTLSTVAPAEAMHSVRETIDDLLRGGIDDAELEAARARYFTRFEEDSQGSYGLATMLGDWQLTAEDRLRADSHLAAIRDVTGEDATAALAASLPWLRFGAAGPDATLDEKTLLAESDADTQRADSCEFACLCPGIEPGAIESCNGKDDDCDGKIDEGVQNACGDCGELTVAHCKAHHTLFISSITFAPAFGSLGEADRRCQDLAVKAGRSGTWRALLTDRDTSLMERIQIAKPVFNTRDQLVAADSSEFFSGKARNAPSADEHGAAPKDIVAWVGAKDFDCLRWTSSSATDAGGQALSTQVQNWLSSLFTGPCDMTRSLYCIDQD